MHSATLFSILACLGTTLTSAEHFSLPDMVADKRKMNKNKPFPNGNSGKCKTIPVLLTNDNLAGNSFLAPPGPPGPGVLNGGTIVLVDPDDDTTVIGSYNYLITFFTGFPTFECVAQGAYTLGTTEEDADQITFQASCDALPFFTVTGGQGKFTGAEGFVEFMIPDDRGFIHEINLCAGARKKNDKLRA